MSNQVQCPHCHEMKSKAFIDSHIIWCEKNVVEDES